MHLQHLLLANPSNPHYVILEHDSDGVGLTKTYESNVQQLKLRVGQQNSLHLFERLGKS